MTHIKTMWYLASRITDRDGQTWFELNSIVSFVHLAVQRKPQHTALAFFAVWKKRKDTGLFNSKNYLPIPNWWRTDQYIVYISDSWFNRQFWAFAFSPLLGEAKCSAHKTMISTNSWLPGFPLVLWKLKLSSKQLLCKITFCGAVIKVILVFIRTLSSKMWKKAAVSRLY